MFEKILLYFLSLISISKKDEFNTVEMRTYTFFDLTLIESYTDIYLNKQIYFMKFINDPEFVSNYDEYLFSLLNEKEYRKSL